MIALGHDRTKVRDRQRAAANPSSSCVRGGNGGADGGDLMQAVVLHAILAANAGYRTHTSQYMALDDVPPDSERRPICVRAVAESLDLP
jgi:hypothetical protein